MTGDFGRLAVGVPYYKAHYEFFQWWSYLIAGGFRTGDRLLNNRNVPGEVPIPMAHNALVREFLRQHGVETLCMIEDDHVADQDVVERIRTKPENQEFDIVCASYVNRREGSHVAVGCNFADGCNNDYGEYGMVIEPFKVQSTGTQRCDVAALGLVLIRRWVLEAMLGDDDPADHFWFDWLGRNSQDVRFYWEARKVGAKVGVDRDNAIGHIGKKIYYMQDFYDRREQLRQELMESGEWTDEGAEHGY